MMVDELSMMAMICLIMTLIGENTSHSMSSLMQILDEAWAQVINVAGQV